MFIVTLWIKQAYHYGDTTTTCFLYGEWADMLHFFFATSFTTEHLQRERKINPCNISSQPGPWTLLLLLLLLLLLNAGVSTLLTHLLLNVESQGNLWRYTVRVVWYTGAWNFTHEAYLSMLVLMTDLGAPMLVCRRTQECCLRLCLSRLKRHCRRGTVPFLRIHHAFQTTTKNSSFFPGREPHKCFNSFCEAHQLCFYLGHAEIRV